jgi:hypothetical protein
MFSQDFNVLHLPNFSEVCPFFIYFRKGGNPGPCIFKKKIIAGPNSGLSSNFEFLFIRPKTSMVIRAAYPLSQKNKISKKKKPSSQSNLSVFIKRLTKL